MNNYTYKYRKAEVGYFAEIFDENGEKLGEAIGFGKADAKKQVRLKLGLSEPNNSPKLSAPRKMRKRKKKVVHEPQHGSVMTGLVGKTSARNWKKVK